MQARMKQPGLMFLAPTGLLALNASAEKGASKTDARAGPPARGPDKWLRLMRRHALSRFEMATNRTKRLFAVAAGVTRHISPMRTRRTGADRSPTRLSDRRTRYR